MDTYTCLLAASGLGIYVPELTARPRVFSCGSGALFQVCLTNHKSNTYNYIIYYDVVYHNTEIKGLKQIVVEFHFRWFQFVEFLTLVSLSLKQTRHGCTVHAC